MANNQDPQERRYERAQALDMALRTPGIRNGNDALKLAEAYRAYMVDGAPELKISSSAPCVVDLS